MQLIYIISKHIVIFVNTIVAYHVGEAYHQTFLIVKKSDFRKGLKG